MQANTISEEEVKRNVYVSEKKDKNIAKVLKDLEETYKKGLISKEAYEKARSRIIEKEREKENKLGKEEERLKDKNKSTTKEEIKKESIKEESRSRISYIKKKHIDELKKMKQNWINDLNSLKSLYEHGIISEEEYERSKEEIEDKIEKIEEMIKKEMEVEELEELKERIEKEIKDALSRGIFREEEVKLKHDLEALSSLYNRGLITKEEYEKKKEAIEKQLENYNKLIELIDAIFDKFIEDINKRIEENKEITKPPQPQKEKNEKVGEEIKKPWYIKVLIKLGLYEDKKVKEEKNTIIEQLEEAYKNSEPRFKISNIAMIIKKEVKSILRIDKAITYKELIDRIEGSEMDENIKIKLKSFFQNVMVKEYLEEEDEKDIENIYKEAREIAELLSRINNKTRSVPKKSKDKGDSIKDRENESKSNTNKVDEEDKHPSENKKKSIFDKINDFFGV